MAIRSRTRKTKAKKAKKKSAKIGKVAKARKAAKRSPKLPKSGTRRPFGKATAAGYVAADFTAADVRDYVVAELRYEAPVAFAANTFTAAAAEAPRADALNSLLANFNVASVKPQFALAATDMRSRMAIAATLPAEPQPTQFARKMDATFIQSGFVQIVPKPGEDAGKIAKALRESKDTIWDAFVAPRPVPAMPTGSDPGSRNFEPSQGYLYSAPNGIGAAQVWSLEGAKGDGVTICDIEGNWNLEHEDLPSGITLLGGTPINDLTWKNHGTAVLGEMVSLSNDKGCVGISHKAKAKVQSAIIDNVFNTAGAIANAASKLQAGDVILIELQATGPNRNTSPCNIGPTCLRRSRRR